MTRHTATLARIRGHVQGVGYRAWLRDQAEELALSGWVRNEADGSVQALLVGPENAVAALLERARTGPRGARVTAIETERATGEAAGGFHILR